MLLAMGDTHCGHYSGLTPPRYWIDADRNPRWRALQKECWGWYERRARSFPEISTLAFNADAIDGKGARSGGVELVTSDRDEQTDMASEAIAILRPRRIIMTRGTPYHVGDTDDWEDVLADKLRARVPKLKSLDIEDHAFFTHGGVTFDMRHHVGTSGSPVGRSTAMSREMAWAAILSELDGYPSAQILLRSHAHYFLAVDNGRQLGLILPALQAPSGKYGDRMCSGNTTYGMIEFHCNRGDYIWQRHILRLESTRPVIHKL